MLDIQCEDESLPSNLCPPQLVAIGKRCQFYTRYRARKAECYAADRCQRWNEEQMRPHKSNLWHRIYELIITRNLYNLWVNSINISIFDFFLSSSNFFVNVKFIYKFHKKIVAYSCESSVQQLRVGLVVFTSTSSKFFEFAPCIFLWFFIIWRSGWCNAMKSYRSFCRNQRRSSAECTQQSYHGRGILRGSLFCRHRSKPWSQDSHGLRDYLPFWNGPPGTFSPI
jgi:hypothetical protein